MTVTAIRKDPAALTMTTASEFDASAERIWQLWADPRQLERWWGPPMYPATVTAHDLRAGGRVEYHMTGPTGDKPRGYWNVVRADAPHTIVVSNGLSNADGSPNTALAMTEYRVTIQEIGLGRTRMTIEMIFASHDSMEKYLAMGMEEGVTAAIGQIDEILAEPAVRR